MIRKAIARGECIRCGGDVAFETSAVQPKNLPPDDPGHEYDWAAYDGDEGRCLDCRCPHWMSADGEGGGDWLDDEDWEDPLLSMSPAAFDELDRLNVAARERAEVDLDEVASETRARSEAFARVIPASAAAIKEES